ncbi:MAG TPA: helicase-related protein [Spirochaetia bacterium]|nr:helicase-related protein [Spirochaetia bacterium]
MDTNISPKESIASVKGVGDSTTKKLYRLGIKTIQDLLNHYPSRYYNFSEPVLIKKLKKDKPQVFFATINKINTFFSQNGKLIIQAIANDSSGKITLTWFNNPYIKRLIKENNVYTIAGKPTFWGKGLTVISPVIEEGDSPSINTRGFVPIYPQTEGLNSRWIRTKICHLLSSVIIIDPLDLDTLKTINLISQIDAYKNIHFPQNREAHRQADKRLSFNEHLKINLNNLLEILNLGDSISLTIDNSLTQKTRKKFPFTLTQDQEKTVSSIYKDLQKNEYTHRLIQGDTGSGKTATLVFAANQCLNNNYSCAIMAPTEILATQHYKTFISLSLFPKNIQLITSSTKEKPWFNKPSIFIGTHSLLTNLPQNIAHPIAFVAIDEQHKFGVKQRDELIKRTPVPHLFNLSATPIPRTVALGLLGDINISNIIHKPSNRLPTKTFVVSPSHFKKSPVWLKEQLKKESKIFVVCPNIADHATGIASVEKISKTYTDIAADKYPVLTLHGKMNNDEQTKTISQFNKQKGGILVSTSLIEVGIDIPSANIMIIHSAERFGLASLHQLRGRVGRGEKQGFCFLVPSVDNEEETERLQLLQKYNSGLVLAQKDLILRGAGEVFGIKQHGELPTRLKYFWSKKLFLSAKQKAKTLIIKNPTTAKQIVSKLETC